MASVQARKKFKIDVNAIRSDVTHSLSQAKVLKDKIAEISLLSVGSAADVSSLEVYFVCRFGLKKVQQAISVLSSAKFLPETIAIAKVAGILELSCEDVKKIINLFKKVESRGSDVRNREVILTPPRSTCIECHQQLVVNHDPTKVRIYTLKRFINGEKWSLRHLPYTV